MESTMMVKTVMMIMMKSMTTNCCCGLEGKNWQCINTSRYLQNFTETATEKEIETIENCVCISFSSAIRSV